MTNQGRPNYRLTLFYMICGFHLNNMKGIQIPKDYKGFILHGSLSQLGDGHIYTNSPSGADPGFGKGGWGVQVTVY